MGEQGRGGGWTDSVDCCEAKTASSQDCELGEKHS